MSSKKKNSAHQSVSGIDLSATLPMRLLDQNLFSILDVEDALLRMAYGTALEVEEWGIAVVESAFIGMDGADALTKGDELCVDDDAVARHDELRALGAGVGQFNVVHEPACELVAGIGESGDGDGVASLGFLLGDVDGAVFDGVTLGDLVLDGRAGVAAVDGL